MLTLFLLPLLGSAFAGGLINPYLSSAGVSYSSYSTAHGPLAFKALSAATPLSAAHLPYAAAPVAAYGAAPVAAYGSAPVAAAYAAPPVAATYAAAPLAATYAAAAPVVAAPVAAPASAVVPVTRVSATPAVVQNVVDVAHPKLATRKYEIRRPAIEKQFYDIEERVVVRPAGSAVVELETPISAGQRGPTRVSPALPVAQPLGFRAYAPAHGVHLAHGVHIGAPVLPAYLPSQVSYVPAPSVHEEHHENTEQFQQQLQQGQQESSAQQVQEQQQLPQQIQPQPLPQPIESQQPEFDSSDSVAIENPEFARSQLSRNQLGQEQISQSIQNTLFRSQLHQQQSQQQQQQIEQQQQRIEQQQQQIDQQQQQLRQQQESLARNSAQISQQQLERSQLPQLSQYEQISQIQQLSQPQYLRVGEIPQIPELQELFRSQGLQQQAAREQQPDLSLARAQRPLLAPRPEVSPRQEPTQQPQAQLRSSSQTDSRSYLGSAVIPSVRNLSPEQSQINQDRLIDLLTARGPVSEVRSANEPVRARVISATPAPSHATPTDSQVNTRRVVVSRPIQTVQEVEVVEPFTKIERVAVHQPAVVKTAHVELAHVPAAVHAVHAHVPTALHAVHAVTPVPLAAHYV